MKKRKIFPILRHAWQMVGRTLKSYALLSVTIVLSLSLFLGYLLYTDASLYNEYKELLYTPRGMLYFHDINMGDQKLAAFLQNAGQIGQTDTCVVYRTQGGTTNTYYTIEDYAGESPPSVTLGNWQIYSLPDHSWMGDVTYDQNPYDRDRLIWLDGQEHSDITLAADEALLPEKLFYALKLNELEEPIYTFRFDAYSELGIDGMTLKIVGLLKDDIPLEYIEETASLNETYWNRIIVSQKALSPLNGGEDALWSRSVYVHTDSPELVEQLAQSMGYTVLSVYEQQNAALEQMYYEKSNKAVIAAALLLLLGINLYSSFSNVLNERKFEIGVKRALGASSWSIVRQFLYESLIVIAVNILVSVALVADVFIVYKFIYERTPDEWGNFSQWTVYISPHSVAMFLVCSVTLTAVFSLIFAYKSTRVEIVRYLKAE